ncbi:MAG: hypothetical protein IJ041_06800 [Clostridia bacterium]|nr:hypothetical protein [Clostridia bacterium]
MAKCAMCRRELNDDFTYSIDEEHPLCDRCGEEIDALLNSNQPKVFRNAVNYINTCKEQADDPVVEDYLNELLENNADAVDVTDGQSVKEYLEGRIDEGEPAPAKPAEPVRFEDSGDYYQKKAEAREAEECSGSKMIAFAKLTLCLGIIASVLWAIILWAGNDYYNSTVGLGFGVLIGGIAASFLAALPIQAFGELVRDTHENKALLKKQVELLEKQVALLKGQPSQTAGNHKKK